MTVRTVTVKTAEAIGWSVAVHDGAGRIGNGAEHWSLTTVVVVG